MTYIEFFDKTAVENLCSSLINPPERIILIGHDLDVVKEHKARYLRVLSERGHTVEIIPRTVNRNKLEAIVEQLSRIVETYDDCCFDLTGGEDLCLVAVGIVKERYPEKNIQLHRVNLVTNRVADCDGDGEGALETCVQPALSVEENIYIYGGEVVYDTVKANRTHRWDMNEAFRADIRALWRICCRYPRPWNWQIGTLKALSSCCLEGEGSLTVTAAVPAVEITLKELNGPLLTWRTDLLQELYAAGYLTSYSNDGTTVSVSFRDEEIKRLLTKEGQVLEMKVYLAALECCDEGQPVYDDVMTGVSIDWDGKVHTGDEAIDTENEIDVMLMHGCVPVFVSCKNGKVEREELYKLNSVAERFGPKYGKRVLVAPGLELAKPEFVADLCGRADEMGIRVITKIRSMDDEELERVVRSFWLNQR